MDYLDFYGLDAEPFKNDFDPSFYFESETHKRARMRLLRAIHQRRGLAVMIGKPGCGKSTLANNLVADLEEKKWAVRMLVVPHEACGNGWFLPQAASSFGVAEPSGEIPRLVDQIRAALTRLRQVGRHPVLLIDEAQLFRNVEAMEEFRGLLNFVHDGERLISLVLFGMHELGEVVRLDPPLAQRVDVRVELTAMDREQSAAYVRHRLERAGGSAEVFSSSAIAALYDYSAGVPRVLNTIADNALFEGYLSEIKPVNLGLITTAAGQLGIPLGSEPAGDEAIVEGRRVESPVALNRPGDEPVESWVEPVAVAVVSERPESDSISAELDESLPDEMELTDLHGASSESEPIIDASPSGDFEAEALILAYEEADSRPAADPELEVVELAEVESEPPVDATPVEVLDVDDDEEITAGVLASAVAGVADAEDVLVEDEPFTPRDPVRVPSSVAAQSEESGFNLGELLDEDESDLTRDSSGFDLGSALVDEGAEPEEKDDEDLDSLFDQILVGD